MAKLNSPAGDFGGAPGTRIGGGRYLLKRLVGRGEFSELWLARNVQNAKDVALKFLPGSFLQDENLIEFFQQEIRRNGLLKHPHIVSTYELVLDHDAVAIAMEFVDGWSLATMKVDKLLHCYSVAEIEPWIQETCEALAYAHNEFGMVHGDLKPSNLLTSTREGIKVSDFGFAALIRSESSKRGIIKSAYSGIGFLSPQQVMGETPSKADDIYSLGATIFDLLTGTPPFYKGEVIAQICSLKPPAMTQRLAELGAQSDPVSPVWEDTVAACLAKNPGTRPQSIEEVLQLLARKEVSQSFNVPVAPEETHSDEEAPGIPPVLEKEPTAGDPPAASPASHSRIGLLLTCVLAALAMCGLAAAFWLLQHGKITFSKVSSQIAATPTHIAGLPDSSFNTGTGADNNIRCMALQPDGKILIGGQFANFNGAPVKKIARLNPDGSLDTEFNATVAGNVYAITLQDDGKILIGGQGLHPGRPARRLIRLDPDGNRDGQFHGEAAYNENVRALAFQPDGKLLVGGDFSTVGGKPHNGLVRLSTDNKIDDSFNIDSDGTVTIVSLAVQSDGKILAAGVFNNFDNLIVTHLVRLNPDGSIDSTFNARAYADEDIRKVLIEKDDKIVVCGYTYTTNNVPSSYLERLNPDGSQDESFQSATKPGIALWTMVVQDDGKIVVAGYRVSNDTHYPYLARINMDGSVDASFQVSQATGDTIWCLAIQPDSKVIAAGAVSTFNGIPCGHIFRLEN
jgi:uncharacterized delta-60 repeat protein